MSLNLIIIVILLIITVIYYFFRKTPSLLLDIILDFYELIAIISVVSKTQDQ